MRLGDGGQGDLPFYWLVGLCIIPEQLLYHYPESTVARW